MTCKNHAAMAAEERCAGCAESYCHYCLVELHGQKYCAGCKSMVAKKPPASEVDPDQPCEAAGKALTYSIIGIFCFGIVLGPMAVSQALRAKKEIKENPRLAGLAKANVGLLLGITVVIFWILGIIERFSGA